MILCHPNIYKRLLLPILMVDKKVVKNHSGSASLSSKRTITIKKSHLKKAIGLIIVVVALVWIFNQINFSSKDTISSSEAANLILDFAKSQGASATLVDTEVKGGVYEIILSIDNQEVPIFLTMDGKYIIPSMVSYDEIMTAVAASP